MAKRSAGILIYRIKDGNTEVLLAHPGGPFWARKDVGAWSIPKGEFSEKENPLDAAVRELKEETGLQLNGRFYNLTPVVQKSGKKVYAWAHEEDVDISNVRSNNFEMEWPPGSGKMGSYPEIDKVQWFAVDVAKKKIIPAQAAFIKELEKLLKKLKEEI